MQLLTFHLGRELFAVEIDQVREVLDATEITSIPKAPEHIRGVINLRGSVVAVMDLRARLGMSAVAATANNCIIILELRQAEGVRAIGALVDGVNEVLDLDQSVLEPPPRLGLRLNARYLKGLGKHLDQFLMLLDVAEVFGLLAVETASSGTVAPADPVVPPPTPAPVATTAPVSEPYGSFEENFPPPTLAPVSEPYGFFEENFPPAGWGGRDASAGPGAPIHTAGSHLLGEQRVMNEPSALEVELTTAAQIVAEQVEESMALEEAPTGEESLAVPVGDGAGRGFVLAGQEDGTFQIVEDGPIVPDEEEAGEPPVAEELTPAPIATAKGFVLAGQADGTFQVEEIDAGPPVEDELVVEALDVAPPTGATAKGFVLAGQGDGTFQVEEIDGSEAPEEGMEVVDEAEELPPVAATAKGFVLSEQADGSFQLLEDAAAPVDEEEAVAEAIPPPDEAMTASPGGERGFILVGKEDGTFQVETGLSGGDTVEVDEEEPVAEAVADEPPPEVQELLEVKAAPVLPEGAEPAAEATPEPVEEEVVDVEFQDVVTESEDPALSAAAVAPLPVAGKKDKAKKAKKDKGGKPNKGKKGAKAKTKAADSP